jgi:hypothetical protein
MRIVRFQASHLTILKLQEAQQYFAGTVLDEGYGAMLEQSMAFTALDDTGQVIVCAGCEERWDGCATAWALLSCDAGQHMVGVVRAVKGFMQHVAPWRRVEAAVDVGFEPGERLMKLLGFECEGVAKAYRPDGADCTIWARIKT